MKNLFVGLIITLFFTACSNDIKTNTDTALTLDTTSATKVFSENNISTQAFTINSEKDTTIKGKSGTTLRIRKNTFVDSSGQIVKGPIEIELKEALDMSDIILGNLTTTYNGNFLESGGMIYTNASSNGSQLKIADGKEIGVVVPSDSTKERMMLFEGIQDSNGINWDNPVAIKNAIKPNESEIRNFCYSIIKPINII